MEAIGWSVLGLGCGRPSEWVCLHCVCVCVFVCYGVWIETWNAAGSRCVDTSVVYEADIIELEKQYWALKGMSKSGQFDVDTFTAVVCPPVPHELCRGIVLFYGVYMLYRALLHFHDLTWKSYTEPLHAYHMPLSRLDNDFGSKKCK